MQEILRLVDALQTADKYKVATPANWKPGMTLYFLHRQRRKQQKNVLQEGYECVDWFLCRKSFALVP